MLACGENRFQLADPVVDSMQVGCAYLICLFPEQINYVDGLCSVVNKEHSAQPALSIKGFAFDAYLHGFAARLDT